MTAGVEPRTRDRAGPYVGLDYFAERDAEVFFGRDAERKMIIGNLRASRLTLLYAQSGVGKSSLLRAGVVARLRRQAERDAAEEGSPRILPVVFSAWLDDPVAGLIEEIRTAAQPFLRDGTTLELPPDRLDDAIAIATNAVHATALVMLDQFEEYFLYHSGDVAGERFADDVARCIARDDVRANFLISIREDVYSSIGDRFQARIHNVYGNYLHLDYLDRTAARDAITQPIERLNKGLAAGVPRYDIEDELVDEVLAQVRRGRGNHGGTTGRGDDGGAVADPTERFETAYLQLVMERLWDEEARAESRVLRAETLRRLEGADSIIRSHVHSAMAALPDEQRVAVATAFRFLVTSSGRKIALTTRELADFCQLPETELVPALRHLENARILRAVAAAGPSGNGVERSETATGWELFHDILADPILSWRGEQDARQAQERLEEAQEETRRAKRRSLVLLGLVVLAVAGLVAAVVSNRQAVERGNERDSQKLAVASGAALATDPDESVGLALDGLDEATTVEAENALRAALPASRLWSILPGGDGDGRSPAPGGGPSFVTSVSFGSGDMLATGESTGRVRVWRWRSKRELVRLQEQQGVASVQLAAGGTRLLTLAGARASLWDVDRCSADRACEPLPIRDDDDVRTAAIGADGCVVATSDAAVVHLDRVSGCDAGRGCRTPERQTLRHRRVASIAFARGSCVLATVTSDGKVAVWRAKGGRYALAHRMRGDWDEVRHVALSPRGDLVAAAGDLSFRVWDLTECEEGRPAPTGCRLVRSETAPDSVNGIDFAPEEQRVVVATEDGVARIWDLNAAEPLIVLRGHRGAVFAATFDASGRFAASASADGTTRVWETSAGDVVIRNREPIREAWFAADGERIVAAGKDGTVRIYGRGQGQPEQGVLLAAATAKILSPAEMKRWGNTDPFPFAGTTELTAAAPSPDGRWILTAAANGTLSRWDVRKCVRRFVCEWVDADGFGPEGTLLPIGDIAYEPQGRLVAIAKNFEGTWILSGQGKRRGVIPSDAETPAAAVAFNGAGDRVVTTSAADGGARVWDVAACLTRSCKPKLLRTLSHPCVVYTATFSPEGSRILTGCGDHVARIWKWEDRRVAPMLLRGHTSNVHAVAFTPDGRRAVTAGTDRTTRIWDARTGRLLGVEQMHINRVQSVAVDPNDPEVILTSSDDGTARLYRCTTCYELETLEGVAENRHVRVRRAPQLLP